MQKSWLERLEFDKVKHQLQNHAVTPLGQRLVNNLKPFTNYDDVVAALTETKEALDIERLKGELPIKKIVDITPHLKRLEMEADLNGLELAQIGQVLSNTSYMVNFFDKLDDKENYPKLFEIVKLLSPIPDVSHEIRESVNESGDIKDSASPLIFSLRKQLQREESSIKQVLTDLLRKNNKYLSDSVITVRNNRYVIPVKQEYRFKFGGMVHDQSSSGQTLFVEPSVVVELNNKCQQIESDIKTEIKRILSELSRSLYPYLEDLKINLRQLAKLDFIQSKVLYAKEIKGVIPKVCDKQAFNIKQARHPLLDVKTSIPNDIYLGDEFTTLVVTGPNTGGKTITLKTIGLMQIMGQSGLCIPAAEDSIIGIYDQVMSDIGDEQSIEQNLSTFSSHMVNISKIMKEATSKSLVLFDELGAGTDPKEGASLAMAILDNLRDRKISVVATTHYPELKWYGDDRDKTINASMEFDHQTLQPTYHLLIGIPGRSNAFDIASRIGLDNQVIDVAREFMDNKDQSLNSMIMDLEDRRQNLEKEYDKLEIEIKESEQLHSELSKAYQQLYKTKKSILNQAKKEANQLIEEAEHKASKIIEDLKNKQQQLEEKAVKEHELIDAKSKLRAIKHQEENHLAHNKILQKAKAEQKLNVGDTVKVIPYGQQGTIISKRKDGYEVQMGVIKMLFDASDLEKIKQDNQPTHMTNVVRTTSSGISTQLDLRGHRYEEAMQEIDRYLDQALLSGYAMVTIIHGKGTGSLREGLWQKLKKLKFVDHYEYAPANAGGNGATVIYFK